MTVLQRTILVIAITIAKTALVAAGVKTLLPDSGINWLNFLGQCAFCFFIVEALISSNAKRRGYFSITALGWFCFNVAYLISQEHSLSVVNAALIQVIESLALCILIVPLAYFLLSPSRQKKHRNTEDQNNETTA